MSDTPSKPALVADGGDGGTVTEARPPLWLLDVDGVLNAVCQETPPAYERIRAEDGTGRGWYITYDPGVMQRIASMHSEGLVEVRWLTTWCLDAAEVLAPALGLPEFAVEGVSEFGRMPHSGWWKSYAAKRLSDAEPDRPLIWTDDDLNYSERRGEVTWLSERTANTLTINPNINTGLTMGNLDQILAFALMCRSVPS